MKTILCYGDSNTWGWNPISESRFDKDVRWPGILQQELGEDYEVISEGLRDQFHEQGIPLSPYRLIRIHVQEDREALGPWMIYDEARGRRYDAVRKTVVHKEVPSQEIGAHVMDALRSLDVVAYVRFASVYREFRDVDEFMVTLREFLGRQAT